MSDNISLRSLRRRVRGGETPRELVEELQSVARRLARSRRLPPSFAPYGQWDDEAADETFASWYVERLVGEGQLLALLDQAADLHALRRLAARSLRQHLLNALDRSQARNLYARVLALLQQKQPERFQLVVSAARPQDRWYALTRSDATKPWGRPERELLAHGWALGDFVVIRYRADAAKLSPVLDAHELERFVVGLLERSGAALTPTLIMRTLSARFALGDVEFQTIDAIVSPPSTGPSPETDVLLRDAARGLLDEISPRQATILRNSDGRVADIASMIGCSVGTVVNEQRRIGALVSRVSGDDVERDALLNIMVDLLYLESDA